MEDTPLSAAAAQVARLAKIELDPDQVEVLDGQLREILAYVGQLQQVEIPPGTEPFFGAEDQGNAVREDGLRPSLPPEQVLANAPDSDGQFYRVPPVFGS